jgi:hypothetical protein
VFHIVEVTVQSRRRTVLTPDDPLVPMLRRIDPVTFRADRAVPGKPYASVAIHGRRVGAR